MDTAKLVSVFINVTGVSFLVLLCGMVVWKLIKRGNKEQEPETQCAKDLNSGHVALACSVIGIAGRWIVLASGSRRGISRVAAQGGLETVVMTVFILSAGLGLILGVVSLFKKPSRWWGLAAVVVTAVPLVYLLLKV